MIVAAHHVGDAHVDVVAHHAQVVGRRAVRAHQDEVVERVGRHVDLAAQQIGEARVLARHQEADDVRLAARDAALDLAPLELEAGARIEEPLSLLLGLGALRLELL